MREVALDLAVSRLLDELNPPTACATKTGMVATGGTCAFPSQCQSAYCAIVPKSPCGTCAAPPAAGASCAMVTTCGQGLICSAGLKCVAAGGSGAACDADDPCQVGFSCVGAVAKTMTKPAVMGKCEATVTMEGAACDATLKTGPDCAGDQDLVCNATSKKCATLAVAAPSAACGNATGQEIICGDGANCSAKVGPDEAGTCTAAVPDLNPCMRVLGAAPCEANERCIVKGDSGANGNCEFNNAASCM